MRPEDLKLPFSWNNPLFLISDRIWYIPTKASVPEHYTFPGWNNPIIFGNDHPVHLEYCSGNGAWIADKAEANPEINWLALEMKFSRVRKIWAKCKNRQLKNLFIVCGEALHATHSFFPQASFQQIYINFPDPWPKRRHASNRIIQDHFIHEIERVLIHSGKVSFVTDDEAYSEWTSRKFASHPQFTSEYQNPGFREEDPDYGTSYFDQLWRGKGKKIRYHLFRKQ
jgi:tRNA (guanine-N7-)-methyltransferase